jgi:CheY-like chemotaxis protein
MDGHVSTKKATVLVVDDIPDNLALISGLLKNDYQVRVANSGEKALKIAMSDSPPDLILLDIMMPGMDGYEVCQRLKHDSRTMNIPIIFVTAKVGEEDEKKGLELGAIDYITKPISPPIVMARVKNHLALKAMADFLRDQNGWDSAERLAHMLKRISGATGLKQLAGKIELAIKERSPSEEVDIRFEGLPTPIDNLIAQLERKLPGERGQEQEQGKTPVTPDQEKLKVVCDKLEALLAEDDSDAVDLLDANAELLDAAFPGQAREIDNGIRSFDFEAALTALRTARGTSAL